MKIKEHTKSLIIGVVILLIMVAVVFICSKVLVELWFCAFKLLVKKEMFNLALFVLWLPGMMFGGLATSLITGSIYARRRAKQKAEFYRLLQNIKDHQKKECERCSKRCLIYKAKEMRENDEQIQE